MVASPQSSSSITFFFIADHSLDRTGVKPAAPATSQSGPRGGGFVYRPGPPRRQ